MYSTRSSVSLFKQALSFGIALGLLLGLEEAFLVSRFLYGGQSVMADLFFFKVLGWTAWAVVVFSTLFLGLSLSCGIVAATAGRWSGRWSLGRGLHENIQAFLSLGLFTGTFMFYAYRLLRTREVLNIAHLSSIFVMATAGILFCMFTAGAALVWNQMLVRLWNSRTSFWVSAMWGAYLGTAAAAWLIKGDSEMSVLKQAALLGLGIFGFTGLIWWITRRRRLAFIPGFSMFYAAMVVVSLLALPFYSAGAVASKGDPDAGDFILISIDTLRADGLSCTGSSVPTPVMDSFSQESAIFDRAYANAPWTLPSVASFLTSRYPSEVNMVMLTGKVSTLKFPDSAETLAEVLQPEFATHAILTNTMAIRNANYWQGFDSAEAAVATVHPYAYVLKTSSLARLYNYFLSNFNLLYRPVAGMLVDRAQFHLERRADSRNFLWLHFLDVHDPYRPLAPFDDPVPDYDGPLKNDIGSNDIFRKGRFLTPVDRAFIHRKYLANIQYVDGELGRLFDFLKREGRWEKATIVVTSDHGEEFWEHRNVDHGHTVYEELVRVPLLIKFPEGKHAGRYSTPVSLLDLAPTIVDSLGVQKTGDEFRGQSLMPLLRGEAFSPEPIVIEGVLFYGEQKAVLVQDDSGLWKLIYSVNPIQGRQWELYNLDLDSGERQDLSDSESERVEVMKLLLEPFIQNQADKAAPIDPSVREQLKALGYL